MNDPMNMISMQQADIPALTAVEMAAVDRAMFTACGLDVLQVMEVAGRSVASFVRRAVLAGRCASRSIVVLCGPGGNGGDGLVAARYLQGWGALVHVAMAREPAAGSAAAHQLDVARRLGIPLALPDESGMFPRCDVIVDGLLGFSGRGAPAGASATLIERANVSGRPIVAIDLPSGLDATTGAIHAPCIGAEVTVTLGLPKTGLLASDAGAFSGEIVVADIGIPDLAFREAGLVPPNVQWEDDWIRLNR